MRLLMQSQVIILSILFLSNIFSQDKPNIIVYLADDLGYNDISVYGAKVVKTPQLQILSENGMTFTNAFVVSPTCAPSRAALLTGYMPARNGAEVNHSFPDPEIPYLIKNFRSNGYKVYAFGKVAHYRGNEKCGFDYHHDEQVDLYQNISSYFDTVEINTPVCIFIGDRRPHVKWTKEMAYKPEIVDLPPYFIDTWPTREHRSRYFTDITAMDQEMGRVLNYLDQLMGENTLTLFTSDHGAQWPFGKWNLYDAGIRTPLIVKWPDKIKAGSLTTAMVSWVDILPTLLAISGSNVPEDIDGMSFMNVLDGRSDHFREEIFTTHSGDGKYNVYPIRSIRTKQYKLIWNLLPTAYHTNHSDILRKDGAGAYWDSWESKALIDPIAESIIQRYFVRTNLELYDIEHDPDEQNNLIFLPEYQTIIRKLFDRLNDWMDNQGDEKKFYSVPYFTTSQKPDKSSVNYK